MSEAYRQVSARFRQELPCSKAIRSLLAAQQQRFYKRLFVARSNRAAELVIEQEAKANRGRRGVHRNREPKPRVSPTARMNAPPSPVRLSFAVATAPACAVGAVGRGRSLPRGERTSVPCSCVKKARDPQRVRGLSRSRGLLRGGRYSAVSSSCFSPASTILSMMTSSLPSTS